MCNCCLLIFTTGKDDARIGETLAKHVVLTLAEKKLNKGYNITGDNFFTLLPLILALKKNRATYARTVRSNRRETPFTALNAKGKSISFYLLP